MPDESLTLAGTRVRLEPLSPDHTAALREVVRDGELWNLHVTLVPHHADIPQFIARSWQRTHVNTEAKLLMLRHAFDVREFTRVKLITDVLNESSRRAIERLGAFHEGVLRSHMVMRDGRIRDSALYSITRAEWPGVGAALTRKLERAAVD